MGEVKFNLIKEINTIRITDAIAACYFIIFFEVYNKFIVNNTGQCYKVVTQGQRKRKEADMQMQLSLTENE